MLKVAIGQDKTPLISAREDKLFITVESEKAEEVLDVAARKFAYDQRNQYGFGTAGIEAASGSYAFNGPDGLVYRREFTLTRPPI